jgi:hypothetical protein
MRIDAREDRSDCSRGDIAIQRHAQLENEPDKRRGQEGIEDQLAGARSGECQQYRIKRHEDRRVDPKRVSKVFGGGAVSARVRQRRGLIRHERRGGQPQCQPRQ